MNRSISNILFALVFIFLGVGLLLINLGVISVGFKQLFIFCLPYILAIWGFLLIVKGWRTPFGSEWFFGSLFILVSLLLTLDDYGYIHFALSDFWSLWPFLIVFYGLSILTGHSHPKVEIYSNDDGESEDNFTTDKGKSKKSILTIGSVKMNQANWALEPLKLQQTIGDYHIDLSKAYIPEKEIPIYISGWIGDVTIIVPESIPIQLKGHVAIGDVTFLSEKINRSGTSTQLNYLSPEYDEATRKINIYIKLKIGDIKIKQV